MQQQPLFLHVPVFNFQFFLLSQEAGDGFTVGIILFQRHVIEYLDLFPFLPGYGFQQFLSLIMHVPQPVLDAVGFFP